MTKPIIVVKVPCKLLYVIQVKEFLIKCSTSWPYLISEFLVAYITIVASDWPRTFFTPKVFLFSISAIHIELMTRRLWVFFINLDAAGFSLALPVCCWHPKNFSNGSCDSFSLRKQFTPFSLNKYGIISVNDVTTTKN